MATSEYRTCNSKLAVGLATMGIPLCTKTPVVRRITEKGDKVFWHFQPLGIWSGPNGERIAIGATDIARAWDGGATRLAKQVLDELMIIRLSLDTRDSFFSALKKQDTRYVAECVATNRETMMRIMQRTSRVISVPMAGKTITVSEHATKDTISLCEDLANSF